ncbi:TPA: Flp family type IVb pilin [Pasteurella multocida]|uniref:Flp family type IVb pilin n=1 Tax=Pasteurella multocida TaxID=747 RepID=UPI0035F383DC
MARIFSFFKCQKGITSIEYGLIAAVLAVFIVTAFYNDNGLVIALKTKFDLLKSTVVDTLK